MTATAERTEPAGRVTDAETGDRYYIHPVTGEQLDSVTTVIAGTDSKPWLRNWYGRTSMAWAVDHLEEVARAKVLKGRQAAVDLGKDAAERERDIKRDAGSHVHDVVERLILWADSPGRSGNAIALPVLPEHLEDAWYGDELLTDVTDFMVDGFVNWVSHFNPRFLASEMPVYNRSLGVAGTLDIIAELDGYWLNAAGDRAVAMPGKTLCCCVDVKSGKSSEGTWKEQLAIYRRCPECRVGLGEIRPTPKTHCGFVLHLRPEYPDGYLFMLVAGADDYAAWERFQLAAKIYRERQKVKGKPGKSVRARRADGTMPGPRICDLTGEGWGRALSPLAKALGNDAELEQVARFTQSELLAVKGIGPKLASDIRDLLIANALAIPEPTLADQLKASLTMQEAV